MTFKDIPSLKLYIFRMIFIMIGGLIYGLSLNIFIIPNNFLSGGVGGIALILSHLYGFPPSLSVLLINIPIFLIGYRILDKHFILASFIGMLSFSFSMHITEPLMNVLYVPHEILASIYGGIFTGLGIGLLFKSRASFGGTDIISAIMKRKYSINMGTTLFAINVLIVGCASILFEPYKGMYSLISMFVGSAVIDRVIAGVEKRISVMIISRKSEDIITYLHSVNRGATLFHGEGSYTRDKINIIYSVIPSTRLAKLKDNIYAIDNNAFVSITQTSEIMGFWRHSLLNKHVYKKDD